MPTDLPLGCECKKVRGVARGMSANVGTRLVCYCDDCQAFARFLARAGILDPRGGTDILQLAPSRLLIEHDGDALRVMRLSDKGLLRWYCGECKTPVGNTISGRVPFVGLIHSFLDAASVGSTADALLGKPIGCVQSRFAIGGKPPEASAGSSALTLARAVGRVGRWWLTGAGKPSPFFDAKTLAPVATPRVLSADERRAL